MAKKIGEVELGLRKEILLSSHSSLSLLTIDAMREGIRCGCKFPPISLFYTSVKGSYVIDDGNHRAVAHYLEGFPCRREFKGFFESDLSRYTPLEEVVLDGKNIDDIGLGGAISCLPRKIAEEFCVANNLDLCRCLLNYEKALDRLSSIFEYPFDDDDED